MKRIEKVAKGVGKVMLALLTAMLMPILIWVGLGVVINQKIQEKKIKQTAAPTIGQILGKAGLTTHR